MARDENTEIEKKYRVNHIPPDIGSGTLIEQGYLAVEPDGTEIRLRKKANRYFQTVKKGSGLVRTEVEVELTEAQFTALWPLTAGKRLSKYRHKLPVGPHVCELDVFCGPLKGLVLAEVEFASIEESRRFAPPDWFGADVTGDDRFKNQYLALHGMPANVAEQALEAH